jgi:hypothetical protein
MVVVVVDVVEVGTTRDEGPVSIASVTATATTAPDTARTPALRIKKRWSI